MDSIPSHTRQPSSPGTDHGLPRPRTVTFERVCACALAVILLATTMLFLRQLWPFVAYPYEVDPTDGDMLNAATRWRLGRPIYGDWRVGDVTLPYTPLFLGILVVSQALGVDPMVFFRHVNVGLFLAMLALVVWIAGRGTRDSGSRWNPVQGLLAGIFLLSAWRPYLWMMPVHPGMLAAFFGVATCALLVVRPHASVLVATLGVLATLSKQSAIVVPAASLLYYAMWDRTGLKRYLLVLAAVFSLSVLYFEIQSRGQFLRGTFIYPTLALSGSWLQWRHVLTTASAFYSRLLWLVPLIVVGLIGAFRSPSRPLALVFSMDVLLEISITRNVGGSPSYLWFHFALAAGLAATGWWRLVSLAGFRLRRFSGAAVPAALSALLATAWFAGDGSTLAALPLPDLASAGRVSESHERVIREMVAAYPGERWIATRSSLALVKAGIVLDQEYATVAIASSTPRYSIRHLCPACCPGRIWVGPSGRDGHHRRPARRRISELFSLAAPFDPGVSRQAHAVAHLALRRHDPGCRETAAATPAQARAPTLTGA